MTNKTWQDTVFSRQVGYTHPNELIAIGFHRASVLLYLTFVLWSIASLNISVPALDDGLFAFESWFSFFVMPIAAVAAVGALYFPRMARLEMFASSALLGLVLAFLAIVAWDAITGDLSAARNFWIDIALVIIPAARVTIIFRSLIRAANGEDVK